ncbi:pilus assembly protein TadG-related protein [Streptomyces sp. NPDC002082]|uniref:pilus assembly protein TadG-related protein n=1 Tax=Streptomyces sp. NPDC002082 TaxID=3154772 RepID=UPI00331816C3
MLPFYVTMVACLLFAAFAFVVVGMAGGKRSEAQGAADAAALAAAREVRDNVFVGRNLLILTPEDWEEILAGRTFDTKGACRKAQDFASSNEASAVCGDFVVPDFTVTVTTRDAVGDSVLPGTEDMRGQATATALIEPRCFLDPAVPPPPPGGPVGIKCRDGSVTTVDPSNPGRLHKLTRKFFSVRLTD